MRDKKEIVEEIAELKELKLRVPEFTCFGNSNHKAIDAEIRVLEERRNERAIYGDDDLANDDQALDLALYARRWLDGGEDDAPSVGWLALCE